MSCTKLLSILAFIAAQAASEGQVLPPNSAGVAGAQWHTLVRDVDQSKKFWSQIGGIETEVDGTTVMKFPGFLVFLAPGSPSGGNDGTVADNVGFYVPDVKESTAKWTAAGLKAEYQNPNVGWLYGPDAVKIEVHAYKFIPDDLRESLGRQKNLTGPVAGAHLHFYVPESAEKDMQSWYVSTFGGIAESTMNGLRVSGIPGLSISIGKATKALVPTRGRAQDYIGLEVKNLEAFCHELAARGVNFEEQYSKTRHRSYASARFTDLWGVSIELSEGLNRF